MSRDVNETKETVAQLIERAERELAKSAALRASLGDTKPLVVPANEFEARLAKILSGGK